MLIDHQSQKIEWRGRDKNIKHRTLVNADNGASQLALWDIHVPKGAGAPPHIHDYEETITVLSGAIKIQLGRDVMTAYAGQTIFIPANVGHSFMAIADDVTHLLVMFPNADPQYTIIDWETWLAKKREDES